MMFNFRILGWFDGGAHFGSSLGFLKPNTFVTL